MHMWCIMAVSPCFVILLLYRCLYVSGHSFGGKRVLSQVIVFRIRSSSRIYYIQGLHFTFCLRATAERDTPTSVTHGVSGAFVVMCRVRCSHNSNLVSVDQRTYFMLTFEAPSCVFLNSSEGLAMPLKQ